MGDSGNAVGEVWPEDDVDWVRLYALRPDLWASYASELGAELGRTADPALLARFMERCLRSVRCLTDVHAQLPGLGLTLAEFVALRERAIVAEETAMAREDAEVTEKETTSPMADRHRRSIRRFQTPGPLSAEMTQAIVNLHLRGLDADRIECSLDIPAGWPQAVLRRVRLHAGARRVVREHLAGKTLGEIAKVTGVPVSSAARILRQIGESPQGASARVDAHARARTIVKLRDQGLQYKQIAERLDCSMDVVKNVLRRDRRTRYGKRGPAE